MSAMCCCLNLILFLLTINISEQTLAVRTLFNLCFLKECCETQIVYLRTLLGIMANMLDCDSEFELQLCYFIHFQIYALKNGMTPLIPSAMGLIAPLLSYKDDFGNK